MPISPELLSLSQFICHVLAILNTVDSRYSDPSDLEYTIVILCSTYVDMYVLRDWTMFCEQGYRLNSVGAGTIVGLGMEPEVPVCFF